MSGKNTSKLSQEQLLEAVLKKRACQDRALKLVESLLEKTITEQYFLSTLNGLSQTHYEDVVVERSILRLCGYPLCDKQLENVPNQQYQISMRTKKVYDITERKMFCSGNCFKASNYIKAQILTSPLWTRSNKDLTTYKLLDQIEVLKT